METNICDVEHKGNKGQKSHVHVNKCRKSLDKIQHPFIIKALKKLWMEGMDLCTIEAIYNKPIANIVLIGKENETTTS
jgi:hypothetical protein